MRRNSTRGERVDRSSSGKRAHAQRSSEVVVIVWHRAPPVPRFSADLPLASSFTGTIVVIFLRTTRIFVWTTHPLSNVDPRRGTLCVAERGCRGHTNPADRVLVRATGSLESCSMHGSLSLNLSRMIFFRTMEKREDEKRK